MEGSSPPALVRQLLLLVLGGLSPVLLLAAVIGIAILIARMRPKPAAPSGRKRAALRSPDALRVVQRMRRGARDTLVLVASNSGSASKLGGHPDMPAGMAWPQGPDGALRFLCQLDLAAVRASGGPSWLPEDGRLLAFHDERHGAADQVRIILAAANVGLVATAPAEMAAWPYRETLVDFLAERSLPSLDWLGEDVATLDIEEGELDVLADYAPSQSPGPRHRIGGYPDELQDEQMALTCESATGEVSPSLSRAQRTWRMLLQIDSDQALGTEFGDSGRLYVFVREAEARRGLFGNTVTISQTY